MDAYLALLPLPARLSARHALKASLILLDEQTPNADTVALAMSLLNQSWSRGRMPLASHLKSLRKVVETAQFQELMVGTPYLCAVADLDEANRAHEAQQTVTAWVDSLFDDDRELHDIWQSAVGRFAAKLEVSAEHPDSAKTLRRLLEALSAYRSDEGLDETVNATVGFRHVQTQRGVPRAYVLDMPGLGRGPSSLLQAILAQGGMATGRAGATASGERPAMESPRTAELPPGPKAKLWDQAEAAMFLSRNQSGGPLDGNAKQQALLQTMSAGDGWRVLQEVPELIVGSPLEALYDRFPHFKDVLDFIGNALALASCGTDGRPVRIPALLLRGPAGVGKTFFAQEVARVLELHFVERDLSVTTEAFVLNGNDASWKGSKPGVVLDTLLHGKTANPLVLLNEVDKAIERGTHNSPIAPMYALLEPTSASRFIDEFVPVPVDASHVNWVLTANDGPIPGPILSRLEVFDIREPSSVECRAIAASVWRSLLTKTLPKGHGFPQELSDEVLTRLSEVSPRVMRKALTFAAGCAASQGRRAISVGDLEDSGDRYLPARRKQIGFVQ